jgi:hypothetical protein
MLTHGASANRADDAVLAVMWGDARDSVNATTLHDASDMRLRGDQQILTARRATAPRAGI